MAPSLLRRALRSLAACLVLLAVSLATVTARAQAPERATLIADSVRITGSSVLIAQGHVEVFYLGRRLTAERVLYDRATGRLQISGPIILTEGSATTVLADQAALSADLTEGILTSARLVLNQQLQLAASELIRVEGRYTALNRAVASSCQVCANNPTPLWEIRARRVIHDQEAQQLYFEQARVRLAGVPVFYLPRLRIPDPTLKRATGFLMPALRFSSNLGTGVKIPYFIAIGKHRDLLITPYLTNEGTRSVELRYRQAFTNGDIEITGSLSDDHVDENQPRGYLRALGEFDLPRDFKLAFQIENVSDRAYLVEYGYPNEDRLDSRIEISRARRDEYISSRLVRFQYLREGESRDVLPGTVADLTYARRFTLGASGIEGGLRFRTHGHARGSSARVDSNLDGISDGRDVARASARLDLRRDWILQGGLQLSALGQGTADLYRIEQDPDFEGTTGRVFGAAGVELRWPLVKTAAGGAAELIEPVAQLVWSPKGRERLPNEDSSLVEFDEGNLFSLNRFPGSDATERGFRANLGVNYQRSDPSGWAMGATLGRVFRGTDEGQFTDASGLDGITSDWLAAWQVSAPAGVQVTNRLLIDDAFEVTKAEVRFDVAAERYTIAGSYVHAEADAAESRPESTSELVFAGSYDLTPTWTTRLSSRYDFAADRATQAGVGLAFRNECLLVDLSLSRRFTSSTNVDRTTEFGISVELLGFGGSSDGSPARQCRR